MSEGGSGRFSGGRTLKDFESRRHVMVRPRLCADATLGQHGRCPPCQAWLLHFFLMFWKCVVVRRQQPKATIHHFHGMSWAVCGLLRLQFRTGGHIFVPCGPMVGINASALTVRDCWLTAILGGQKSLEVRKYPTKLRGIIGLIKAGDSQIYGTVSMLSQKTDRSETSNRHLCQSLITPPKSEAWSQDSFLPVVHIWRA